MKLGLAIDKGVRTLTAAALDEWGGDVLQLEALSNGHALLAVGEELFRRHNLLERCHIDERSLRGFLLALEREYGGNAYHCAAHAADVAMSMHHFLTRCVPQRKCSDVELLAAYLGALCHDFRHPGTTNAHEVKVMSPLALTYNDCLLYTSPSPRDS